MKRLLAITIGSLCLLTAGMALAGPGDPIGGDDPGCAPANKDVLKCSDGNLKNFAKAWAAAIKCHIKQADSAFKNAAPADDEACETNGAGKSAHEKHAAARGPTSKINAICTQTCLGASQRAALGASYLAFLESNNNKFYPCGAGTTTTTTTSTTTTTVGGVC